MIEIHTGQLWIPRQYHQTQHVSKPVISIKVQVQKATGINVDREKNKSRHANGTKGGSSQIIIRANREHQAQEKCVYLIFLNILVPATGVLASCIFPPSSVLGKSRGFFPP